MFNVLSGNHVVAMVFLEASEMRVVNSQDVLTHSGIQPAIIPFVVCRVSLPT
jgi:hypothetical protein